MPHHRRAYPRRPRHVGWAVLWFLLFQVLGVLGLLYAFGVL